MIKATLNGFLVLCILVLAIGILFFGVNLDFSYGTKAIAQEKDTADYKTLYYADNKLFNEALQRERELKTALQSEHERAARLHEQKVAAERQRDAYLQKINQAKSVLQ